MSCDTLCLCVYTLLDTMFVYIQICMESVYGITFYQITTSSLAISFKWLILLSVVVNNKQLTDKIYYCSANC